MLNYNDIACDLETRSVVDLKKSGARRYAADRTTAITVAVWSFRDVRKSACPLYPQLGTHTIADLYADIFECIRCGGLFKAHNANFDVNVLLGQNPFLAIPVRHVDCTMGRAQALAYPGGLDEVCKVFGLPGKDPEGHAAVMKTCKPDKHGRFCEDYETYVTLVAYAKQDLDCLINIDERLPQIQPAERRVFERTWRRNEIGLPVDTHLATAIALRRQEIEEETSRQLVDLTNGSVTKLSQRARILDWANSGNRAAGLESTKKYIVDEKLQDQNLHPDVRTVLELLKSEGGSAPLKAQTLLDRHVNGWYKDGTRYFGARSGRGTSEGVNVFNIARPSGKFDGKEGRPSIDQVIDWLKAGLREAQWNGVTYLMNNTALSDCLRGCVGGLDGYAVIDNDLSNAEYRIAMWMAGDQDRLNMLAANGDPYMFNAIQMGWVPPGATKETHPKQRQDAKPVTLGGNYQLGWKTYMAQQRTGGRRIDEMKAQADIMGYRSANPKLEQLWHDLAEAFKLCIYEHPGRIFPVGKVAFQKTTDGTVWMLLPSGRCIPHYSAHITTFGEMAFFRGKYGAMRRQKCFGGSLLEIACQSITRDIITTAEDEIEIEMPDTHLVLDVYDSILALAPVAIAKERAEQMRGIMCRERTWTAGLPIDSDGYIHVRMKK